MSEKTTAERITAARENLGISKAEAARRLNLSKIGYCRYEYGDRVPSPQTLEVIARVFGTSVAYLSGESEDMSPDFIMINKKENPELFELIKVLSVYDTERQNRLLAYAKKLNAHSKK